MARAGWKLRAVFSTSRRRPSWPSLLRTIRPMPRSREKFGKMKSGFQLVRARRSQVITGRMNCNTFGRLAMSSAFIARASLASTRTTYSLPLRLKVKLSSGASCPSSSGAIAAWPASSSGLASTRFANAWPTRLRSPRSMPTNACRTLHTNELSASVVRPLAISNSRPLVWKLLVLGVLYASSSTSAVCSGT